MHEKRASLIALARSWSGPRGARRVPAPPPSRPIDDLVRWAFCEELPKTPRLPAGPGLPAAAWAKMQEFFDELSLAGLDINKYGVVADPFAQQGPHADALAIHAAVVALDDFVIDLPGDWDPLGDCPGLGAPGAAAVGRALDRLMRVTASGQRRPREIVSRLVVQAAVLGPPDGGMDRPEVGPALDDNGRPAWFRRRCVAFDGPDGPVYEDIEVDGWDTRRACPHDGAYQRIILTPDPVDAIVDRGRREIWHSAMVCLAEQLAGVLTAFSPAPPAAVARPWENSSAKVARILPDLAPASRSKIRK